MSVFLLGAGSAHAAAPVHACDTLAAFGLDPFAAAAGVALGDIDAAKAVPACQEAVKASPDELRFQYQLGRALLARGDDVQALLIVKSVAMQNYPAALNSVGHMVLNGLGTARDPSAALNWYLKGAETGNSVSMNMAGRFFEGGWGVQQDYAKAFAWYQRAANAGNPHAMNNVGMYYQFGRSVPQDSKKALIWFQKSAGQGVPEGLNNLGTMHYHGYAGLPADRTKAFELYSRSAGKGYRFAQNNLAEMYEDGKDVKADLAKALELFNKAAAQGHGVAMVNLARLYDQGRGVAMDREAASGWLMKALKTEKSNIHVVIETLLEQIQDFSGLSRQGLQAQMKKSGAYAADADGSLNEAFLGAIKTFQTR